MIDRIRSNGSAGQTSRSDLLFANGQNSLLSYYALANEHLPTGGASVMQLLELIKPHLTLSDSDINLLITPLNGVTVALPAEDNRSSQSNGASNEPLISLPKAAGYSTGLGLSIGTIWWTARMSGLVTSALLSTPAWRTLDPLPVITSPHDDDPEHDGDHTNEDKDVEHLFDADRPVEEELPLIQ